MRYPSPTCDIGILFFQAFQAGNDLLYRTPWDNSILLYKFYTRVGPTEPCHSASEKSSVTYHFSYFGRIDLIKTRKSNYEII
jgi:hypothetical protein